MLSVLLYLLMDLKKRCGKRVQLGFRECLKSVSAAVDLVQ